MKTSVITLKYKDKQVKLIGSRHIASKEYYQNLESEIEGKRQNANDTNRNQQVPRPDQQSVQRPARQIGLTGEPGQGARGPTQ